MGGDLPFLYRFFVLLLEHGSSMPIECEAYGRGGLVSDRINKFLRVRSILRPIIARILNLRFFLFCIFSGDGEF
jgi:hypothetical protein